MSKTVRTGKKAFIAGASFGGLILIIDPYDVK